MAAYVWQGKMGGSNMPIEGAPLRQADTPQEQERVEKAHYREAMEMTCCPHCAHRFCSGRTVKVDVSGIEGSKLLRAMDYWEYGIATGDFTRAIKSLIEAYEGRRNTTHEARQPCISPEVFEVGVLSTTIPALSSALSGKTCILVPIVLGPKVFHYYSYRKGLFKVPPDCRFEQDVYCAFFVDLDRNLTSGKIYGSMLVDMHFGMVRWFHYSGDTLCYKPRRTAFKLIEELIEEAHVIQKAFVCLDLGDTNRKGEVFLNRAHEKLWNFVEDVKANRVEESVLQGLKVEISKEVEDLLYKKEKEEAEKQKVVNAGSHDVWVTTNSTNA